MHKKYMYSGLMIVAGTIALICWLQDPSLRIIPVFPIVAPMQVTRMEFLGNCLDTLYPSIVKESDDFVVLKPCSRSVGLKNGIGPPK